MLLILTLFAADKVTAHAELLQASPAPGVALENPPGEVRLLFSEPVTADSTITIFGEGFQTIPGIETQFDPQTPEQVFATIPELEGGVYTVQWSAVSADGHLVSGSYSFSVAVPFAEPGYPLTWWQIGLILIILVMLGVMVRRYWQPKEIVKPSR